MDYFWTKLSTHNKVKLLIVSAKELAGRTRWLRRVRIHCDELADVDIRMALSAVANMTAFVNSLDLLEFPNANIASITPDLCEVIREERVVQLRFITHQPIVFTDYNSVAWSTILDEAEISDIRVTLPCCLWQLASQCSLATVHSFCGMLSNVGSEINVVDFHAVNSDGEDDGRLEMLLNCYVTGSIRFLLLKHLPISMLVTYKHKLRELPRILQLRCGLYICRGADHHHTSLVSLLEMEEEVYHETCHLLNDVCYLFGVEVAFYLN